MKRLEAFIYVINSLFAIKNRDLKNKVTSRLFYLVLLINRQYIWHIEILPPRPILYLE